MDISKLEEANTARRDIAALEKCINLHKRIIAWAVEEKKEFPPLAVKCNPIKSDFVVFEARYMPVDNITFLNKYLQNMEDHLSVMNEALTNLLK